jgi:hypothetical protein
VHFCGASEAGEGAEVVEPEARVSGSGSPRSSLRTISARMHQNVCLLVLAFLPLPFPRSYVVLTRLPSMGGTRAVCGEEPEKQKTRSCRTQELA